jgi:DNA-binding IclR family transcriptional regulator
MMINPMTPQRAAVLAVLQKAGRPLRVFEIVAATGMKPANVQRMLYAMRQDGQADCTGSDYALRYWAPNHSAHSALTANT